MTLRKFLLILKARFISVSAVFLSFIAIAVAFSLLMPKSYEASTSLVLNYKGIDPVTGVVLPAQLMPGYMATQMNIIASRNVSLKVVEKLKLTQNPIIQEQYKEATDGKIDINIWLAERLLKSLEVEPDRESSVIAINYTGADPNFAALLANTFAEAYQEANVQLKVEPAKKAATFFGDQISVLKDKLEQAQSELSAYQQENGITSTIGTLDIEVAKLNEISTQLVMAKAQLYDSTSRKTSSSRNQMQSPDVAMSPIVQQLRVNVAASETNLSELSEIYGVNHPLRKAAKAQLDRYKASLSSALRTASGNVSETKKIDTRRVAQLKAALAAQKKKMLKLNLASNELTVLQNEVLSAQKALDAVNMRYTQTNQESSSNQSDITVLNPAVPPQSASSPNLLINLIIAIFLGSVLGVGLGILKELLDQRVRGKDDVMDLLEVPVFSLTKPKQKGKSILPNFQHKLLKQV